ncbi:hypothetical protein QBC38DRAFT_128073 [Podospora fimiseda]|uniref:Proteophosphoglycan ppg4 n=1 Tax=Podospora fimiseda TaxID=252190 RepID=A0AAN7BT33_9PEZI|nr:hypothetical protein QBC38DRAFT_128073 [Podospora fimiseda]
MGNAQSSETTRRPSQKLSKPKTNNHATAGLLSPSGSSKNVKRLSNAPLPNPPPMSPSAASTLTTSSIVEFSETIETRARRSESIHSITGLNQETKRRSLFRSRTSQGGPDSGRRDRNANSGPTIVDRMSRTSSLTYESAIAYYGPPDLEEWETQPRTRTSWNYNLTSYEAKRLLNLAEEPHFEHGTVISENRMTVVSENTRKSSNPADHPSAPITRANSDVSLYAPVRRRSIIQTPGVATRSNSMRHTNPPRFNPRYSHPPTPSLSRQQSFDSYRSGIVSMPPRYHDRESVPRVSTPCEDEYQSIGAFKLGSLRITNGAASPVSPEVEKRRGSGEENKKEGDYFERDKAAATAAPPRAPAHDHNATTVVSQQLARIVSDPNPEPEYLSVVNFSPLTIEVSQLLSPQLQTTSKHSALEDDLFEDDVQQEYSSLEVLDVRLDTNAKSPHVLSEAKSNSGLSRTDSGFISAGSPSPQSVHKPLTKADSGYSSNVSLRSFQSKVRDERPQKENPPPVPPKDVPSSTKAAVQKTRSITNLSKESNVMRASNSKTRLAPAPIKTFASRDKGLISPGNLHTPASEQSSKPASTHSIAVKSPRPNRLQRLLSTARRSGPAPLELHATHTVGKSGIPSIPQEVENKLNERTGLYPTTSKRLALKPRASLDTLKTIFSVGSMEITHDAPSTSGPAKETRWRQTLHIAQAASQIIPRKSIARKPVPIREQHTKSTRLVSVVAESAREGTHIATLDALVGGRSGAQSPLPEPRRSLQMDLRLPLSGDIPLDLPSPLLPSPLAKAMSLTAKTTPPPVSMATRKQMAIRVPPPLRPKSSTSSLRRQASRESIHSYPAAQQPLPRNSSRESIHSYPSYQPSDGLSSPPPTMDPRRLASFRKVQNPQPQAYQSHNGEVQTDHGLSRQSSYVSLNGIPSRSSFSSDRGLEGYGIQRPSSAQPWMMQSYGAAPLSHRPSYEDYSYERNQSLRGYPPSMSNGYTAGPSRPRHEQWNNPHRPPSAASTWSRSQFDAAAGQWYQPNPYPPHVSRSHYRKRSMSTHNGPKPPYRVLHSYNSPAYRNAPIWG